MPKHTSWDRAVLAVPSIFVMMHRLPSPDQNLLKRLSKICADLDEEIYINKNKVLRGLPRSLCGAKKPRVRKSCQLCVDFYTINQDNRTFPLYRLLVIERRVFLVFPQQPRVVSVHQCQGWARDPSRPR